MIYNYVTVHIKEPLYATLFHVIGINYTLIFLYRNAIMYRLITDFSCFFDRKMHLIN